MLKIVLLSLAIVILTGTGFYYYSSNIKTSEPKSQVPDAMVKTANPTPSMTATIAGDNYLEYSSDSYLKSADKKRVIFFYAAWCPTCRPADAEFKSRVNEIPSDVVLLRANYDTESALKKQYGITYQHTFVLVDESGNEITKWNGGSVAELIKNTQ